MAISSSSHCSRLHCRRAARLRTANCRKCLPSASAQARSGANTDNTAALSITATAAASALLAKVSALTAAGIAPAALLSLLHGPATAILKPSEKVAPMAVDGQSLAGKTAVARAPAPGAQGIDSALPRSWEVATSAAHWFELNRQATAAGALLATVFISTKAARVHAPLLDRLRCAHGTGSNAAVRFVFVHVTDGFDQRSRACATAAAAAARGSGALTLGRVSHTAALFGLDVALSAFLPDGVRAFPTLLLTGGPAAGGGGSGGSAAAADDASVHFTTAATNRVGELAQLAADWAFFTSLRRAAAASSAAAVAAAADVPVEVGVSGGGVQPPLQPAHAAATPSACAERRSARRVLDGAVLVSA